MNNSKRNIQELKEKIIQGAFEVFSHKGYEKTTLIDIAELCDTSRTPIYYHFGDKENLHKIVTKSLLGDVFKKVSAIYDEEKPFLEIVKDELIFSIENYEFFHFWEQELIKNTPEASKELIREYYENLRILKKDSIKKAMDRGEITEEVDINDVVTFTYILYNGIFETLDLNLFSKTREDFVHIIDFFIGCFEAKYCPKKRAAKVK